MTGHRIGAVSALSRTAHAAGFALLGTLLAAAIAGRSPKVRLSNVVLPRTYGSVPACRSVPACGSRLA
jgi:hypothetical protein